MSIDSDIVYYKNEIGKIEKAIPNIKLAITKYNESLEELKKIKGVSRCEEFKTKIKLKIDDLEELIKVMNKEIRTYNSQIQSLQKEKALLESAQKGGEG